MEWIDIRNKKPSKQNQILVLIDGRVASVVKYNGYNFTEDGLDVEDVTHWCYLTEPPKSDLISS